MTFSSVVRRLFIFLPVMGVAVFGLASTVQAAKIVTDLSDLKNTVLADKCADPSNCMGWHYCAVDIKIDGAEDRKMNWITYNAFNSVPIFDIQQESNASHYNKYRVRFNCTTDACGFDYSDIYWYSSDKTLDFVGSCKYENPFCCCQRNSNGRLTGCTRAVDYGTNSAPTPSCASIGADYRPFTEKTVPQYASAIAAGSGCSAFQDAINKDADAKAAGKQPVTQSSIDLKKEAATLNQTTFTSAEQVIGQVIKILLSFVGSIALALYIGAGILWMTALGNSERIDKAKSIFVWTTLGLIVMLSSYFIVNFLFVTLNV